ncbi:site-specific DNA-methyltransferase [Lactococcus insecticola]|uniref:Site-specific DNA-methyltransferase n=1 Tax=Pseudolactococcus insecticola TaxID=2709158 RepID=A0A6A0B6W4_9LACT|nr:site-specific DNA-methyltransferase [Lactococcus insecticola]GFH40044.1 site-specific DNA-methyltransferase [Lactococcus insecticola]
MTDQPEKINLSDVNSRKVDNELLNELRDLFAKAEEQKERYDFTWNGKAKAYFEAATPTTKTLHPQPEESYIYTDDDYKERVDTFDDSENLFITGDNLEALKLLQESYLNKIDMIYIDPPYNTGKDFVYHDNFKQTQKEADAAEGSVDEDGNRLVKNEKSNGRYHSDWLSMMYPRLKLARNLLSDTGVIFVSIDDNEQANLKLLMDEVFGSENGLSPMSSPFIWKRSSSTAGHISNAQEYILAYAKSVEEVPLFQLEDYGDDSVIEHSALKKISRANPATTLTLKAGLRFEGDDAKFSGIIGDSETMEINGIMNIEAGRLIEDVEVTAGWAMANQIKSWQQGKITLDSKGQRVLEFFLNPKGLLRYKKERGAFIPKTILPENLGSTKQGGKDVENLLGTNYFSFPKPVNLMKYFISFSTHKNDLILDFFAGSGTTAQAVMEQNAEDGGQRKFIVATLDETTPEDSEARKAGYSTIDQISRERIRRAAAKIGETSGFRALKVDKVGLKEDVFKTADNLNQESLLLDVDNQADERTDFDLLYDVLVDGALEYNRQITRETINDEEIIKYDYLGELSGVIAYFGDNLTDELTREIAKQKPLIAVFKETTFNKSADKVNVLEQFRIISPDTKVKVI